MTQCIDSSMYINATLQVEITYSLNSSSAEPPLSVVDTEVVNTTSPYTARYSGPSVNQPLTISPNTSLPSVCVTIEHVRVVALLCSADTRDYVDYPEGPAGLPTAVSCVSNATGSPGMVTCDPDTLEWDIPSEDSCQCMAGYEGSSGIQCIGIDAHACICTVVVKAIGALQGSSCAVTITEVCLWYMYVESPYKLALTIHMHMHQCTCSVPIYTYMYKYDISFLCTNIA